MKPVYTLFCGMSILAACSSVQQDPGGTITPDRDSLEELVIEQTLDPQNLVNLADSWRLTKARRNAIIQARLAEIDILYYRNERDISREVRSGNFGFSLAKIFVGGIGSQAAEATAQSLNALSAVLEGAKSAYDRDILLEQSMEAFVSQMRANRAAVKARIVSRYNDESTAYTLQMALSDLTAYQQAGTLDAALSGITEIANKNEKEAQEELRSTEDKMRGG